MDEARAYGIPIICVVDVDRQTQREVIDHYMEKGFGMSFSQHSSNKMYCKPMIVPGWLFDAQVISFTTQERDACIDRMISAIRRAIEYCHSHDTLTSTTVKAEETVPKDKQENADAHEINAIHTDALESQLKERVIAVFGSARAAFDAYSKHGVIGKKEMKKLLKKVLPSLN